MHVYEVCQIAEYIRQLMEYDETLADLWIHGEVSNFSRSPSGHSYFTLKDGQAQLRCALFKGSQRRIGVELRNGLSVFVHGRVSFYETQGTCQLYVDAVQPEGVGVMYLQFEALKVKLEAEGLFSQERKRRLPAHPRRIALITSPAGAVLHDFLTVVARRYPLVEVVIAPSSVQGESAPSEVISALQRLNMHHEAGCTIDLIVIARGGGSMEDLSAFNHEGLSRAVFASMVPVVSAIGHETDYTILDFVADVRAPTPSAAAEIVTPNILDCRMQLADLNRKLIEGMQDSIAGSRMALDHLRRQMERQSPNLRIDAARRDTDNMIARGHQYLAHRLQLNREQVRASSLQLDALSPLHTLRRGYSLCHHVETGALVRSRQDVQPGDRLEIRVSDGTIDSTAT